LLNGATQRELADAGIGWVVVESGSAALDLPVAYRDGDITLYDVGGTAPAASGRALLIAAHVVWLVILVGAGAGALITRRRGHLPPKLRS
jgi:hypothetical protein